MRKLNKLQGDNWSWTIDEDMKNKPEFKQFTARSIRTIGPCTWKICTGCAGTIKWVFDKSFCLL